MINSDKCNGCCKTLTETCGQICVPNKTENSNLSVFNLIARKIESKTLTHNIYHVSVNVSLMVPNVIQIKSRTMINVNVSAKIQ